MNAEPRPKRSPKRERGMTVAVAEDTSAPQDFLLEKMPKNL